MSKKELQKDIKVNGGYTLSTDTLNLNHLLAAAYDLMEAYKLRTPLKKEILEQFGLKKFDGSLWYEVYHGNVEVREYRHGDIAISPYTTWEDVCNYFDSIAPSGYYFGSLEGDGACIGFFTYGEWEEAI